VSFLFIIVAIFIWRKNSPETYAKFTDKYLNPSITKFNSIFYERKIVLLGVKNVNKDDISQLLPNHSNNIYWWIFKSSVEKNIQKLKLVDQALISFCDTDFVPKCFTINIIEKFPQFIAISGNKAILLDSSGLELESVTNEKLSDRLSQLVSTENKKPKLIVGLYTADSSSDQILARFNYIKNSISKIEAESKIEFSKIELLSSGELLIKPSKANFNIQFDNTWENSENLTEQIKRLKLVLGEISHRLNEVKKIDLAYNRLAVVAY
jgi:hypothetical protein